MQISSQSVYKTESADFDAFLRQVVANVPTGVNLFLAEGDSDLFKLYLRSFPEDSRQEYKCRCCKSFLQKYGRMVYIDESGRIQSALWNTSVDYGFFNHTVDVLQRAVRISAISDVLVSDEDILGTPEAGGWTHFAMDTPEVVRNKSSLKSASEVQAEYREEFSMLQHALGERYVNRVPQALKLLRSGKLNRANKFIPHAEWLQKILTEYQRLNTRYMQKTLLWRIVAEAPKGFAHVSSSTLGSLLKDISCMSDNMIIKRFNAIVDPTKHNRPQTKPGAQNVKRGEEIIHKLGLEDSLRRRFAKLDELDLLWKKRLRKAPEASSGVFASVATRTENRRKGFTSIRGVGKTITFSRFLRTVLPKADRIQTYAPARGHYVALCTEAVPGAENILRWNNPVNWYVYSGGSNANSWNLKPNSWVDVTGITYQPNMWADESPENGEDVFFILNGCRDTNGVTMALFPEVLRPELQEVRKTIEEFSNSNRMEGKESASACGIRLSNSSLNVRVMIDNVQTDYVIDRLD